MDVFAKAGAAVSVTRVGDMMKISSSNDWNDREINSFNPHDPTKNGISREDQAYWDKMEAEMKKHPMTPEQKQMMAELEAGMFMPKTKLVEESQRRKI